jgi:outer membrane protein
MRKTRFGLVLVVALLGGMEARAQFANKRLGFELGGFSFNDRNVTAGLAVQLEGNYYIENGFDVGIRVPAILLLTRQSNKQEFGTGGQLYFRYLFSEESFRPYAGLAIDVLVILRGQDMTDSSGNQQVFWGPQAFGGIDYFVVDTVSIGARAFFTAHIAINNQTVFRPTFGGYANVHFYF